MSRRVARRIGLRPGPPHPVTAAVRVVDELDGAGAVVWVERRRDRVGLPRLAAVVRRSRRRSSTPPARRVDERMPLVLVLASRGADIAEGIAALRGVGPPGQGARRLLGHRADDRRRRRPGRVRPGAAARRRRPRRDDGERYAFVSGPDDGRGVHRRPHRRPTSSAEPRPRPPHRRAALVVADREAATTPSPTCSPTCPPRRRGAAARGRRDDPVDRAVPEAGDADPADVDRQLRRARGRRGDRRRRRACSRSAAAGRANVVTAFATIGGRPIGIVANQPISLAGTLDIPASQKAARFVAFCDAFNLPMLTLVDTPGFYPGKDLEWRGMIRHGAQLVFAYARATVPRICVILRKSYGGAYIVMDSKTDGQRPVPRLAVGRARGDGRRPGRRDPPAPGHAGGARRVRGRLRRAPPQPLRRRRAGLHRRRHRAGRDPRAIAAALAALADKREGSCARKHDNEPL